MGKQGKLVWTAAIGLSAVALAGCQRAADMSCEEIAARATEISQNQAVKITRIRDVREVSKTENERRCTGMAETSVGTNEAVTLRGYEENGNQIVMYEGQGAAPAE